MIVRRFDPRARLALERHRWTIKLPNARSACGEMCRAGPRVTVFSGRRVCRAENDLRRATTSEVVGHDRPRRSIVPIVVRQGRCLDHFGHSAVSSDDHSCRSTVHGVGQAEIVLGSRRQAAACKACPSIPVQASPRWDSTVGARSMTCAGVLRVRPGWKPAPHAIRKGACS